MLTHVDLFSGIGGFALAARRARVETIAFAEIDPYATRVLQKHWPNIRNYGRVQDVPALSAWLLTGGVPCQPASVAGKRRGTEDDRWLWPEALAVVERGNYEWVLFENPTGILSLNDGVEFERICLALESQGYEVQPLVIPACAVGAPHRRNRIWIMAHATEPRLSQRDGQRDKPARQRAPEFERGGEDVANTDKQGSQRRVSAELRECAGEQSVGSSGSYIMEYAPSRGLSQPEYESRDSKRCGTTTAIGTLPTGPSWWATEPNVGRVANGIPKRVDRLRCLGNAIVPAVAFQLIKRMIESEQYADNQSIQR